MKYAVVTFGCRVNQADSLAYEAELTARGGEAVPAERADLVVVNTCSVTASADQGARQAIRRIARGNPAARIVATGCFATRAPGDVASLPGIAAVVPNGRKSPASVLEAAGMAAAHGAPAPLWTDGPCGRPPGPGLMGRTAWTLRVQTGCEEHCSYCVIPSTRGASRSRPPADVLAEVGAIIEAGYREVAITGVHLGAYGRDLAPASSLHALLAALASLPASSAPLFRVSSLEPMDCTPAVVDVVAAAPFAPHLHLPLQHASDRMLARMGRPYSLEQYAALVDRVRARMPHAAIGTDVIVGFPGETDEDAERLATYLEASPITHVHVFPYSDRPGTAASAMGGRPHGAVVKARAARLREISRTLQARFRAAQAGSSRRALVIDDGRAAVTDNYLRVPLREPGRRGDVIDLVIPAA
ncbi:MAG: MiaB/RimO family radical SAM methylthiotransferase [Vicinamibacterales bacterium]